MTQQQTDESEANQLGGLAGETVDAVGQVADSKATKQAEKEAAKADKKENKKAKKDATKAVKKAYKKGEPTPDEITITAPQEESKITPKKARNAVGVARVIAPALIPVIAPYAVRAAGAAREAYDRYQARRIGVRVDQLGEFTGRGAGLHARIAGLSDSLSELRKSSTASEDDRSFTGRADESLRQLAATVRAAERMPATRRKSAHRAVSGELDQLEGQLLRRLGV